MINDFFCPLPFNHLFFKPNGTVQACCEAYSVQLQPAKTLLATANLPEFKQLRRELLDPNIKPKMCERCIVRETKQDHSVRTNSIHKHSHLTEVEAKKMTEADGTIKAKNFKLQDLDIRWSNLCNYQCRFCGLVSSSKWLKDHRVLFGEMDDKLTSGIYNAKTGIAEADVPWEQLKKQLPNIRHLKLAGGEPTIMPGTYQLLEEMIRIGNTDITISLITNASMLKYGKKDLLELLSKFTSKTGRNIRIQLSLEGMGLAHEWQRSGVSDWDKIAYNLEQFWIYANQYNWKLNFHSGISWMNMYHLADFVRAYPHFGFVFNIVNAPDEMSMINFYKDELIKCSEYYEDIIENDGRAHTKMYLSQIKQCIDRCITTTNESINFDKFNKYNQTLDKTRGQSFLSAFPEWSHLYA